MDIHWLPRSFIQVAASYAAYRAGQLAESTGAGRGPARLWKPWNGFRRT